MMAISGMNNDSETFEEDQEGESDSWQLAHTHLGYVIGILVMVFVAFNDGLLAVLARTMKDVHFSILMFWFAAIGVLTLTIFLLCSALITQEIP